MILDKRTMRIGILSRNRGLYSTRRLLHAANARGHHALVIDTIQAALEMGPATSRFFRGRAWAGLDALIPRIGASITWPGVAVVRQFEAHQVFSTASAESILNSRNKWRSVELMLAAGLAVPATVLLSPAGDIAAAVAAVGGYPIILKPLQGTHGQGVLRIWHEMELTTALPAYWAQGESLLIQEYIRESEGQDLRIIVIGDRCVAAMRRTAAPNDYRANLHRGGAASVARLTPEINELARRAARAHSLQVAGVDVIQSERGPLLLEVNSSPGLQGIEKATKVNVASAIIHHIEVSVRQLRRDSGSAG